MSTSPLKPILGNIIIQPIAAAAQSAGGIIFTQAEQNNRGVVIAVGPGEIHEKTGERVPMDVAVGDTVVYSEHAQAVNVDGQTFFVVGQQLIHAIVV